jgi:hypothetical protein
MPERMINENNIEKVKMTILYQWMGLVAVLTIIGVVVVLYTMKDEEE